MPRLLRFCEKNAHSHVVAWVATASRSESELRVRCKSQPTQECCYCNGAPLFIQSYKCIAWDYRFETSTCALSLFPFRHRVAQRWCRFASFSTPSEFMLIYLYILAHASTYVQYFIMGWWVRF